MVSRPSTSTVLAVVLAALLVAVLVPIAVSAAPWLVGADHSYVVLSSSMEPTIQPDDVVIVDEVPPEQIEAGDIITYRVADQEKPITHRVTSIDTGEEGRIFLTRGDAVEESNDPTPVREDAYVGRVMFHIPYLGGLLRFADTPNGKIALLFVPGVLLVVNELYNLVVMWRREREGGGV